MQLTVWWILALKIYFVYFESVVFEGTCWVLLEWYFSTRLVLPPGAFVNVGRHFWLSKLGECYWYLVGRGQGCIVKNDSTQNVNSSNIGKPYFRLTTMKSTQFVVFRKWHLIFSLGMNSSWYCGDKTEKLSYYTARNHISKEGDSYIVNLVYSCAHILNPQSDQTTEEHIIS